MGFKHKQKKAQAEQPRKRLHAYIATPAYDGKVQTDYAMSVAETCQVATALGINVTVCMMRNAAFIDLARNNFVRMFLETNATHLFFLDADLKWEPRAFIGLVQAGKPICAGVYPKRQDPEEFPCRLAEHKDGGLWVEDGWVMCDRVPTGFLCIERSVVEAMAAKAPKIRATKVEPENPRLFYTFINEDRAFVGEDYAFCGDYVAQYGQPIPVWPDFDFVHGERWKGNYHDYLNRLAQSDEVQAAATQSAA